MYLESNVPEPEPPLWSFPHSLCALSSDDADEIMLAAAPPTPETRALVISRHTLQPILQLMKCGCTSVATQSLDAPGTHLDPVSLVWIADLKTREEMTSSIHRASICLNAAGCMVLDATGLAAEPTSDLAALNCLIAQGYRLRTVLRKGGHLILVATHRPQATLAA